MAVAHDPMMKMNSTESILMTALSTLPHSHLSHLTHAISSLFHRRSRRLSSILSSPILFSVTLRHLHSLSFHHKSLLISRYLFSNLTLLKHFIQKQSTTAPPPPFLKLRDLDAALILLLLCEIHQHDRQLLDTPHCRWRFILCNYASNSILKLSSSSGGGFSDSEALIQYIELIGRCRNFVNVLGFGGGGSGSEGKEGTFVAASAAAVVALPSVEVRGGVECVICKEEMKEGREVCELPCSHLFHWICILQWLKKTNTCPCCRHRLPTEDVRLEIDGLLEDFAKIGGGGSYQFCS